MEARMDRKPDPTQEELEELEEQLEEGLRETFPASDAPTATQPVHKPHKKRED
jgi:hypothetical protein